MENFLKFCFKIRLNRNRAALVGWYCLPLRRSEQKFVALHFLLKTFVEYFFYSFVRGIKNERTAKCGRPSFLAYELPVILTCPTDFVDQSGRDADFRKYVEDEELL